MQIYYFDSTVQYVYSVEQNDCSQNAKSLTCNNDTQMNVENNISFIIDTCLKKDNVYATRCFECDNVYVIALLTTPFYLKSERDDYLQSLQYQLSSTINANVYATFDMDIFRMITDDMPIESKRELLNEVISRIKL